MFANQSGIYAITNTVNEKMYIGSAKSFGRRWQEHRYLLRSGTHHSVALQKAWNKYGENEFTLDVVEFVERARLIEREQVWLDFFKPKYNMARVASAPMAGLRHSTAALEKMRTASKGNQYSLGFTHSAETREKMRAAHLGVLNSPEARAKISAALKGRTRPPGHCASISAAKRLLHSSSPPLRTKDGRFPSKKDNQGTNTWPC